MRWPSEESVNDRGNLRIVLGIFLTLVIVMQGNFSPAIAVGKAGEPCTSVGAKRGQGSNQLICQNKSGKKV